MSAQQAERVEGVSGYIAERYGDGVDINISGVVTPEQARAVARVILGAASDATAQQSRATCFCGGIQQWPAGTWRVREGDTSHGLDRCLRL